MKTTTTILVALSMLCAAAPARALDRWTWQDTAWEAGFLTTLALDWRQTLTIATETEAIYRCDGRDGSCVPTTRPRWHEQNPLLGRRPSPAQVHAFFAANAIGHAAIAALLPARWRRAWQVAGVGLEAVVVGRNAYVGINMRF